MNGKTMVEVSNDILSNTSFAAAKQSLLSKKEVVMNYSRRFSPYLIVLCFFFLLPPIAFSEDDRSKIPIPFINPAGDLSVYEEIYHKPDLSKEFELQDPDGKAVQINARGEYWYMSMAAGNDADEMKETLLSYLDSINASIHIDREDTIIFSVKNGESEIWWGFANLRSYLELTVIKENYLKPGKSLTFKMGKDGKADDFFYIDIPGNTFNTLFVTVPDGTINLHANVVTGAGFYSKSRDHSWVLDAKRGSPLMIDNLPQDKGKCIFHLSRYYDAPFTQVTIRLVENSIHVPSVKMGETVGALRIKNVPYGWAKIEPEYVKGGVSIEHPEYPGGHGLFTNGDLTPSGDIYMRVPAGLWKVVVQPRDQTLADVLQARHIPVNSGEETVLQWPWSMTSVFGVTGDGGLKINDAFASLVDGNIAEITFSLLGKDAEGVKPDKKNIEILEGGVATKILDVKPSKTPMDVVLLLDSSGSMKGQMKKALVATQNFVKSLPDNAVIRVVDFDTKPKLLNGTTKEQVLESLKAVKANGATCLNDSVLLGLDMLKDSKRPALLLFTDGFDANWDDSGPGSKANKKEVLNAVPKAEIPVFTIGFGKNHDRDTLPRIASLSGGQYFPADNQDALREVFSLINSNLGNTFEVTYSRPEKSRPSDVPVISYVVDVSGSMDVPLPDGNGYRNDKIGELLHNFILGLPDTVLGQVISFDGAIYFNQVMTDRKADLLRSISMLRGTADGTDILGAVNAALKAQAAVPSNKRTMVFITDAALEPEADNRKYFETLLGRLKDENIRCLWIGIGSDLDEKAFKHAAQKTGGHYVITEDPEALTSVFTDLTNDIRQDKEKAGSIKTLLQLTVKHRDKSGQNFAFANSKQVKFSALKTDKNVEIPASIAFDFKKLESRYNGEIADLVTGDSVPVRDAQILKRLPIGVTGANNAASIKVKEALFLNRLHGVTAPSDKRFLALTMEMKNILPVQDVRVYKNGANHPAAWLGSSEATKGELKKMVPTYLIPDLKRHLFLRWNKSQMVTLSPATWLTSAPLTVPGEDAVALGPQKPVKGTCVYLVSAEAMDQLSLHFYDMNYGHMDIPLVGAMPDVAEHLSALPPKPPVELSDAFKIALREVKDVEQISGFKAGDDMVLRIVEADFISKVQALLDVSPAKRFSLRLMTPEGALHIPLHNSTSLLPLGFMSPTMLSPGSSNRIRLAFRIPKEIAKDTKGELVIDLKGSGVVIALGKKDQTQPKIPLVKNLISGNGIDLNINKIGTVEDGVTYQVVDITLFDKKDGESTSLSNAFILKRKGFKGEPDGGAPLRTPEELTTAKGLSGFASGNSLSPPGMLYPDRETENRIFGFTDNTIVPDGQHLRGILLFQLPGSDNNPSDWQLESPFFKSLNLDMQPTAYQQENLLAKRLQINIDPGSNYAVALEKALIKVTRERKALTFEKPGRIKAYRTDLENSGPPVMEVPVPEFTTAGSNLFKDIRDIKTLKARLTNVRWLPTQRDYAWAHRFSPEAVLTQNWGTEGDLARMAEIVFSRQGTKTRREYVDLTDEGRKALARLCGLEQIEMSTLPALMYYNEQGGKHLFVAPFMKDLRNINGFVTDKGKDDVDVAAATGSINVSLLVVPKEENARGTTGDMGSALAGEDEVGAGEWIKVFYHSPELPSLSQGAVDIGFAVVGYKKGPLITAIFDGNKNRMIGQESIDTGDFRVVGGKIEINLGTDDMVHEFHLSGKEKITDFFHTLGLNLPDLSETAAQILDQRMKAEHKDSDTPDDLSGLKWYTRHKIYPFIIAQTKFEDDLAAGLKLVTGRVVHPRAILVTVSRKTIDSPVVTRLDLQQIHNDIHKGSEKDRAAFNIASGIFCSQLEERILGEESIGYFGLLKQYPEGTKLRWLTPGDRDSLYDQMRELKYPKRVIKLLEASPNTVLFPSSPAIFDGKPRWAWLEVDPYTFRTITVLDNGDHGSMTEKAMTDFGKDAMSYLGGGMMGAGMSVWGVSGFSLITDDYKLILKEARAFVMGLGEMFSQNKTLGPGDISWDLGKLPQGNYSGKFKNYKEMFEAPKAELGGFSQGFKDGVAAYFYMAQ